MDYDLRAETRANAGAGAGAGVGAGAGDGVVDVVDCDMLGGGGRMLLVDCDWS